MNVQASLLEYLMWRLRAAGEEHAQKTARSRCRLGLRLSVVYVDGGEEQHTCGGHLHTCSGVPCTVEMRRRRR